MVSRQVYLLELKYRNMSKYLEVAVDGIKYLVNEVVVAVEENIESFCDALMELDSNIRFVVVYEFFRLCEKVQV